MWKKHWVLGIVSFQVTLGLVEKSRCSMADFQAFSVTRPCIVPSILTLLFSLAQLSLQFPAAAGTSGSGSLPKLLLISVDGFGWNFLGKLPRHQLPNFDAFINRGVQVRWVENVFPTMTRTNHMSLISGLYAESHGIIHNHFYDPVLGEAMPAAGQLTLNDSKWVDMGAEPVWVTNSQAGKGRRSGSIYWPCADAKIKGRLPDEIKPGEWTTTEEEVTPNTRIDWALDWLTGASPQYVNFAAVYLNEPDEISHMYGPDSQEVLDAIVSRDKIVGHLLSGMKEKNLEDLNVIITADHGHMPVYPQQVINIDLFVDPSWYTAYPTLDLGQPMVNLWPQEGKIQAAFDKKDGRKLYKVAFDKRKGIIYI